MTKFHINPATGNPGVCNPVKTGKCKYGDVEHFSSKEQASVHYENLQKESTIADGLSRTVEEVEYSGKTRPGFLKNSLKETLEENLDASKGNLLSRLDRFNDDKYEKYQIAVIKHSELVEIDEETIEFRTEVDESYLKSIPTEQKQSLSDSALTMLIDHVSEDSKLSNEGNINNVSNGNSIRLQFKFSTT